MPLKDPMFTTGAVRMLVDVRYRISVGLQTRSTSEYPSAAGPEDDMDCSPAGQEQLRA